MMFETAPEYDGDTAECERGNLRFVATMYADDDCTPPWDREDGHGPVSDWRRRNYAGHYAKRGGELLLSDDGAGIYHGRACFYDFAEAVRIARRAGWGYAPQPMTVARNSGGRWHAWFGDGHAPGCNVGGFADQNEAIRALYAAHRATMTARQYAAAAARADFERLRGWCADQWHYVGIAVQAFADETPLTGEYDFALWGIESDAGEYLVETANKLLEECETAAVARLGELAALAADVE